MKALLYKDFVITRKWLLVLLIFSTFMMGSLYQKERYIALPAVFTMIGFIIPTMTFGTDDQCRFQTFMFAAPITPKVYVLSKYMASWLLGLFSAVSTACLIYFSQDQFAGETVLVILGAFAMPTLLVAVIFPLFFKFGVEKSRVIMLIAYLAIFGMLSFAGKILAFAQKVIAAVSFLSSVQLAGILFLIVLALLFLSVSLSHTFVRGKEY